MDTAALISAIVGGIVILVGVVTPAVISIIVALRTDKKLTETKAAVIAGAEANAAQLVVQNGKIDQVHVLSNSKYVLLLRRLALRARREAERTGLAADLEEYNSSLTELHEAETAAKIVEAQALKITTQEKRVATETAAAVAVIVQHEREDDVAPKTERTIASEAAHVTSLAATGALVAAQEVAAAAETAADAAETTADAASTVAATHEPRRKAP